MDYGHLFAFVLFAEELSFTRAARRLHLSQPALHVQIRKLGEAVGRPLYRRQGRALSLTPEGRRLAAFGRETEERGREALAELRGERPSGPVVLAAGQGAFMHLLGPALRRFPRQRWPLRLLPLPGPAAVEAVRDARAHLAVAALDEPPGDLAATPLRDVGQSVMLPRGHRLARRRSLRPADLAGEALVVAPAGSPHRGMIAAALAGLPWTVAVEAAGWELMLQLASLGAGVAVVNDFCRAPAGMVAVPLAGPPRIRYFLLARPGARAEPVEHLHRLLCSARPMQIPGPNPQER